ncbi:hypothetical protein Hanom_Chr04g00346441 [Helianthus anomalus]
MFVVKSTNCIFFNLFGFEALFGDDGGLLLGVATLVAAVAALSRVLLAMVMMKCHSEPFSLCDD